MPDVIAQMTVGGSAHREMFAECDFGSRMTSVFDPHLDHVAFLREYRYPFPHEIVAWTNK